MNLFIIESPFQLLSAFEANYFFNEESLLVIKYNGNVNNDEQLRKLKNRMSNFKNLIEIRPIFCNFDSNIQLLKLLKKFINKEKRYSKIFIGDYRSFHMRKFFDSLQSNECYLLDDGNATLDIFRYVDLKKDKYYFSGIKGNIKKWVYRFELLLFKLNKYPICRKVSFFTCFDIASENNFKLIKHNFEYIKTIEKAKKGKNMVYFYGSNLELLDINNELELEYLKYIVDYYQKRNIDMVYIPHRNESQAKISNIKNKLSINIKINEYPAEIQLALDEDIPNHISSFVSSVLLTLPSIYYFDSVVSFMFPLEFVKSKYRQEINTVKEEYKKHMQVVEL